MILFFWISLILLTIFEIGAVTAPSTYWGYGRILVVICLAILGVHSLGVPR